MTTEEIEKIIQTYRNDFLEKTGLKLYASATCTFPRVAVSLVMEEVLKHFNLQTINNRKEETIKCKEFIIGICFKMGHSDIAIAKSFGSERTSVLNSRNNFITKIRGTDYKLEFYSVLIDVFNKLNINCLPFSRLKKMETLDEVYGFELVRRVHQKWEEKAMKRFNPIAVEKDKIVKQFFQLNGPSKYEEIKRYLTKNYRAYFRPQGSLQRELDKLIMSGYIVEYQKGHYELS